MEDQNTTQMTEQEMLDFMRDYGERLARMLTIANIPDEQKQAWLVLVEEMDLNQLDRLSAILQRYMDVQAQEELGDLRQQLIAVRDEYDKKLSENAANTNAALDDIMKQVTDAEQSANK